VKVKGPRLRRARNLNVCCRSLSLLPKPDLGRARANKRRGEVVHDGRRTLGFGCIKVTRDSAGRARVALPPRRATQPASLVAHSARRVLLKRTTTACRALFALTRRVSSASPADKNSRSSRPAHRRHAGPGLSMMRRSPVPLQQWHFQVSFSGWITRSSGARLALSTKRSRLLSESSPEIQWVRYSISIVGSPLLLKRNVCREGSARRSASRLGLALSRSPTTETVS
jgi:hypothetical protein